jgi:5,6-dimethylbenzimidazole synthase
MDRVECTLAERKGKGMNLFEAIRGRRSCRNFLPDPVGEADLEKILESATWAPSPLNGQPWEFMVITGKDLKEKIFSEAERCRQWAVEKTGWKWLGRYDVDFLRGVPAFVGVVGDPEKGGVDRFQEEGGTAYQQACAAAIQNMQLAAHALGYATLWFTLFQRDFMRQILGVPKEKVPLALLCVGKASAEIPQPPRKDFREKTTFLP